MAGPPCEEGVSLCPIPMILEDGEPEDTFCVQHIFQSNGEHVETVVRLDWKNPNRKYMYIDYKPDHRIAEHGKATYQQIAEYVQEHFGLHVTNLNIAQVKDRCGLEKRLNYNLGVEGHRVPQVTPEKENAIRKALKHFNMID